MKSSCEEDILLDVDELARSKYVDIESEAEAEDSHKHLIPSFGDSEWWNMVILVFMMLFSSAAWQNSCKAMLQTRIQVWDHDHFRSEVV